jgi:putative SbcD/Mre11-related phosphoesterase
MRVLDDWLLTSARAAIHLPTATAVVADLHLGYGDARHRRGDAVPMHSAAVVLEPLAAVMKAHQIRRLVVAGDLFEAGPVPALVAEILAWCASRAVQLHGVVPGNHDRGLAAKAPTLPVYPHGVALGRWRVVHGDGALPDGLLVQGHEHPVARWTDGIGGPCYLVGRRRIVLPAFSADAAGVNVINVPRWRSLRCWVIAGERVLDFGLLGKLRERMERA